MDSASQRDNSQVLPRSLALHRGQVQVKCPDLLALALDRANSPGSTGALAFPIGFPFVGNGPFTNDSTVPTSIVASIPALAGLPAGFSIPGSFPASLDPNAILSSIAAGLLYPGAATRTSNGALPTGPGIPLNNVCVAPM